MQDMRFAHRVIDFLDPAENYSLRELLPGLLQGRVELSEIPIYSDPESSSGFFLKDDFFIDELIAQLSPAIYLIERYYQRDDHSGGVEYQQIRFEDQELLASRYDMNGDGQYELLHFFEDNKIRYRIYLNDPDTVVLEYDTEEQLISEEIFTQRQFYQLPEKVQATVFSGIWQIPE